MAGFGRREIELMQALCIYNRYIECYSVLTTLIFNTNCCEHRSIHKELLEERTKSNKNEVSPDNLFLISLVQMA